MANESEVDLEDFGLFDAEVQQCPHAYYAKMQRDAPVYDAAMPVGEPLRLITRYDDVAEILRDTKVFSSSFDTGGANRQPGLREKINELYEAEGAWPNVPTLLTVDPPAHTRYRRLISKAFSARVISELEPMIREVASGLIDDVLETMARDGSVEFVETMAVPLPVIVIAKALNVPDDRLGDFKRWSDASVIAIGTQITVEQRLEAEREVIEFQRYFAAQLEERRTNPQGDILTNLLNARIDRTDIDDNGDVLDDEPLTMAEMLSIIKQLLVAGNETTTKMLTEMMRLLGEHPHEWEALRADPSRARNVVEETLRLSCPTQGMFRNVTTDTVVSDVDLAEGDQCVIMFASASRDPEMFDDPDTFDPDREGITKHLAFGKGTHFCLGAGLSRLEGVVVAQELAKRIARFTLADSNDFAYHPSFLLRGLYRLHLHVEP